MIRIPRLIARYRPALLTTKVLYPKWSRLLETVRFPVRHGLIIVLPQESERTRQCLLAVGERFVARGGAVRWIEASPGLEKYYEVRQRLCKGRW